MSLIASDSGGSVELIPEDNHAARCVAVVDIGTQPSAYGDKRQCIITWEIPAVRRKFEEDEADKPALISAFYTLSLNEKANLRKMLQGWRGKAFTDEELKGFDVSKLVGVPCLLAVIHDTNGAGNTRSKINNVSKLPDGMACPAQETPSRVYDIDQATGGCYEELPDWVKSKIGDSNEFSGREAGAGAPAGGGTIDDDIPFAPLEPLW